MTRHKGDTAPEQRSEAQTRDAGVPVTPVVATKCCGNWGKHLKKMWIQPFKQLLRWFRCWKKKLIFNHPHLQWMFNLYLESWIDLGLYYCCGDMNGCIRKFHGISSTFNEEDGNIVPFRWEQLWYWMILGNLWQSWYSTGFWASLFSDKPRHDDCDATKYASSRMTLWDFMSTRQTFIRRWLRPWGKLT